MSGMRSSLSGVLTIAVTLAIALHLGGCRRYSAATSEAADLTACAPSDHEIQESCDIVLETYPRYDDADAIIFDDLPIKLFFHSQTPPPGTEVLRPIRAKAALPLGRGACRDTGIAGLRSLQRLAVRHRADAVVNIRATWQGQPMGDEVVFGCRRLGDRYALIWEGALARMPAKTAPDPTDIESLNDSPHDAGPKSDPDQEVGSKLRKLNNLYYQGLITREELEERRLQLLNALTK